MKKYIVFKTYQSMAPDVAFMSDDLDRARMWAEAVSAEEGREYVVVSTTEVQRFTPVEG